MTTDSITGYQTLNHWKDRGCSINPSCFTCPLDECKFEVGTERRNQAIARDRARGMSLSQLASRYRISKRTIMHAIQVAAR